MTHARASNRLQRYVKFHVIFFHQNYYKMDIGAINKQHAESRKVQNKILKWDDKESPLAKLADFQIDIFNEIEELNTKAKTSKKVNKHKF